jgi:predicted O-methyltransferase YrrM
LDIQLIESSADERAILNRLEDSYKTISEMTDEEREFLNALILRKKPIKLLELGVSAGGSSIVILNAIKEFDKSTLFSIDYSRQYYRDFAFESGYFVDRYSDLKSRWKLFSGGLALEFMDEIGDEIDFCLIDTVRKNPCEILDILMILPYLKDDAIVVFRNVNLYMAHYSDMRSWHTKNLLFSALFGQKLAQKTFNPRNIHDARFANIGAIQLTKLTKEHIFELFNLLTIKWEYIPNDDELEKLISFFAKHYDHIYIDYFQRVAKKYQTECNRQYKSNVIYQLKQLAKRVFPSAIVRWLANR